MSEERSSVWGKSDITLPPYYAAFVNGIAVSVVKRKHPKIQKISVVPV